MDDREFEGLWWLPESEDRKIGGLLRFTGDDGISLRLLGSFSSLEEVMRGGITCPLILGITHDSKQITLIHCDQTGSQMGMPGYVSESYRPTAMLIGGHFEDLSKVRFHRMDIQYSNLAAWASTSGFSVPEMTDTPDGRAYRFSYEFPPELTAQTSKGEVRLTYLFSHGGASFTELKAAQSTLFRVDAGRELDLDEWNHEFVKPLQDMLTLGTRDAGWVMGLTGSSQGLTDEWNGRIHERPVEIVYQQGSKEVVGRKHHTSEMLINLPDIRDEFERAINTWLQVAVELDSVCNLYFSIRYAPQMYVEQRFLNMIYAAESYHRRRVRNGVLSKAEHRQRTKRILDGCPEDDREWLRQQLAYSNEPRLADRLDDLMQMSAPIMAGLLDDSGAFVKEVVKSRNFYTHYDKSLREYAAEGSRLYLLAEALGVLVQSCLLREMGIALEKQLGLFRRSGDYQWLADNLRIGQRQARRSSSSVGDAP